MSNFSRRDFLKRAGVAGAILAGFPAPAVWSAEDPNWRKQSPNEKLNIGVIGTAGRAGDDLNGVISENIVALCDVDAASLGKAKARFPKAEGYADYRKMLERKDLDAVVIGTPDHTHAPPTIIALKQGMHVYCEKPLTHTVWEAREASKWAKENKRVTQMGTQIHAERNYRRVVELVQSGAIGTIGECHVWCGGKGWVNGRFKTNNKPKPESLDWDLWLGPAPERPYQDDIHPGNWRKYWEYGGGVLADMGCHFTDLAFWALKLRHPLTVEAKGPPVHADGTPLSLRVAYTFPKRDEFPPLALTWYDGDERPPVLATMKSTETRKTKEGETITEVKAPSWGSGVLFIGSKGMLMADYGRYKLFPEAQFKDFKPPAPSIPDSIGHHKEWIQACKTGGPTTCNFDYSGALTETILLGNVAYRVGQKLEWDAANLKATNCPAADKFITKEYRKGWSF